jgi:peroxiredoxin
MDKLEQLKFNDLAPDLELAMTNGDNIKLSSLWNDRVLLLAFIRHFGCPQCKEMLDHLVGLLPGLGDKGYQLAVITQGTLDETKVFCGEYAPGIMCLSDPERKAYTAYGLGQGNMRQTFLSPNVWRSNRKLNRQKGWKTELPPPGQDALLMSAIFVIGSDGRIRLPYYYDNIADHPPVDLLLSGVMGMDWDIPFESPIDPEESK